MAKKATQAKATPVIDLTQAQDVVAEQLATMAGKPVFDLAAAADDTARDDTAPDDDDADSGDIVLTRELGWTQANRVLKHGQTGIELDIASIAPAGLLYLIKLGYTTSLTQVNAGKASDAQGDTRNPDTEFHKRAMQRAERIQAGTVRAPGTHQAATPRDADAALLHTLAWAAIQRLNAKRGIKLEKGTDKALAITRFLQTAAGEAVKAQAQAMAALDLD